MDSDIETTIVGVSVTTQLLMDEVYGSKNALLEFIDLGGTNYKFIECTFRVYGPMSSKFMDLSVDTSYKLMDLTMHFWISLT